jgi:hypothetical protein
MRLAVEVENRLRHSATAQDEQGDGDGAGPIAEARTVSRRRAIGHYEGVSGLAASTAS